MANIKLTLPGEPFTKQIVTFTAPCDCASVTNGLVINGQTYTVCDAMGNCVTGKGGAWCAGAQISVVLDCEKKKAYVQNAAVPEMTIGNVSGLQSALDGKAASSHAAQHASGGSDPITPAAIGARPNTWMPSAADVKAVPVTVSTYKDANTLVTEGRYFCIHCSNTPTHGFLEVRYYDGGGFAPTASWGATKCIKQTHWHYGQHEVSERIGLLKTNISTEWEWSEWKQLATTDHTHDAGNITSGTLPVARGGTGVTANPSMLINLASTAAASVFAASPRPGVTGVLPVANGGTGVSSLDALATAMGAAKVEIGSYKGTGTYGTDNKNVLTFSFNPKVVIINDPNEHSPLVMVKSGWNTTIRLFISSGNMCYSKEVYAFTDNVVDWYCTGVAGISTPSMATVGANAQLNDKYSTYSYIGIG